MITGGSLCSGYGGLDEVVESDLRWVAETDPDASAILGKRFPDVPNFGDIITRRWTYADHVDLLTSGDPCQSMSAAGRRLHRADERFLWPHVLDAIHAARPKEIFLENVQNIVRIDDGAVLAGRLADLRNAGYAVRWTVLGACAVGAPHHRHRWFLRARYVGHYGPEAERVINKCGAPRAGGRALLPSPTTADGSGGPGTSPKRMGGMNLRTAVQLLPTPLARDADGRGEGDRAYWDRRSASRSNGLPLGAVVGLLEPERWGRFAEAIALWEEITGRPAPDPTTPAPKGGRRLNAELSEWMMGLPFGALTGSLPRNAALKIAGNGVVTRQARAAWDML